MDPDDDIDGIAALVARDGVAVQAVFGTQGEKPFSGSATTPGAARSSSCPACTPRTAEMMLRTLDAEVAGGWAPTPGGHERISTCQVEIVECPPWVREERSLLAGAHLGTDDIRLLQAVFPDAERRFPDDPGCNAGYAGQERFGEPGPGSPNR